MSDVTSNTPVSQPSRKDKIDISKDMFYVGNALGKRGRSGFIPEREIGLAFIEELISIYERYTDEQIEAHNNYRELEDQSYLGYGEELPEPKPAAARPSVRVPVSGYVYLAYNGRHYKIGMSKNPNKRMATLRTASGERIWTVALILTPDMRGLEVELHTKYAHCRLEGEWFALSPEDVEAIKGMAE